VSSDKIPGKSLRPVEVVSLTVVMSLLMYLHRYCISPLTDTMVRDLSVDRAEFGTAVGAFFYAYAFLQMPAGWLSDRFGARWTLPCFVAIWSLAVCGLGTVSSLTMLIAMRLLLGVGQAGAYPTAAATLKLWIRDDKRARCNSAVATGGRAGGLLAMALTPVVVMLAAQLAPGSAEPWRLVMFAFGLPGLLWSVWWIIRYRNRVQPVGTEPLEAAEPTVEADTPVSPSGAADAAMNPYQVTSKAPSGGASSIRPAVPSMNLRWIINVVLLGVINVLLNFGWIFLVTWMPTYLGDRFGDSLPANELDRLTWIGNLTAFAGLAGMAGNMSGGFLTDALFRRFGNVWSRRIPGMIAGAVAGGLYLAAMGTQSIWLFVGLMGAVYFFADLLTGAIWAVYQDIGGSRVAVVLGFANMCGNLGAAAASGWFGSFAKQRDWTTVFLLSSGSLLTMAVLWLFVGLKKQPASSQA